MEQPGEDQRLKDYLLGSLSEPEQVRLEEEYLANPETQNQLLIVEDELVDAYLQGELSAQERKQLEARFLASPRGNRKLSLAKSIMTLAGTQKQVSEQSQKAAPRFSMRWAFATAALLFLLALVWSAKERVKHPEYEGSRQNPINQPTPPVAQATQVPQPEENSTEHPQSTLTAAFILRPTARNLEPSQQIKISQDALEVKIQLDLETDNHKSYKAALLGAEDDVKWSSRGLKSQPATSGRALVLKIPAALFKKGEYTFLLSPDEGAARPIAEYTFTIQKN